jgi:hypothetical protein
MQARYLLQAADALGPPLAPVHTQYGIPLVKASPAWFDPALQRSNWKAISAMLDGGSPNGKRRPE